MKSFKAEIAIMPHDGLLDPQGKAVESGLKNLGLTNLSQIRVGKHIKLLVTAETEEIAQAQVKEACEKMLANLIMERFTYSLIEIV